MKATVILTTLLTAGLALAPASPAVAADYKMYSANQCQVFGPTAWSDLHITPAGIRNLAATPRNIICPLEKDDDLSWDGQAAAPVRNASVHAHWRTGSEIASLSCHVYTTNSNAIPTQTFSFSSGLVAANSTGEFFTIANLDTNSGTEAAAMMLCTLGPQVTFHRYYLYEQADTN